MCNPSVFGIQEDSIHQGFHNNKESIETIKSDVFQITENASTTFGKEEIHFFQKNW